MPLTSSQESVSINTANLPIASQAHPELLAVTRENHFVDTGALVPEGWLRKLYRIFQPMVEHAFGFQELWRLHAASVYPPFEPNEIARRAFDHLIVSWEIPEAEFRKLAAIEGPLVVVANHPFGGLDSLALAQLLERLRPGQWKFISNIIVSSIKGLGERFIPLDPLGQSAESKRLNKMGLYASGNYLRQGGLLGLFPGGRVSHKDKRFNGNVVDRPWNDHFLRQAKRAGATVACLHIPGSNSRNFLKVPPQWPKLRALFLSRELTRPPVRKVSVQLAGLFPPQAVARLVSVPDGIAQLRAACFLRSDLDIPRPQTTSFPPAASPVGKTSPDNEIFEELETINSHEQGRLVTYNRFTLYLAQGYDIPKTLKTLGVGRETTFRVAGQGTGKECDLSPEDDYYHHLVLWDRDLEQVAGSYRIGFVRQILEEQGHKGLYLDHVFKINPKLYQRLGYALELSRSYLLPSYQGDPDALAGLWKGLGMVAVRFKIQTFFGSVTISNTHHPASRAILVEYLRSNHSDTPAMRALIQARNPFQPASRYHGLIADAYKGQGLRRLAPVIDKIENGERGIPPLIRYYCNLGARFLDYHVEADFGNALYCLLRVELAAMPPAYRKRFLPEGSHH